MRLRHPAQGQCAARADAQLDHGMGARRLGEGRDIVKDAVVGLDGAGLLNELKQFIFGDDGLDAVEGQFDLIAVNPPIRAGKAVVYKLFAQSAQRLSDGGSLYVVMRKAQGAESAEKELKTRFARVETVERGSGYRVFRAEK